MSSQNHAQRIDIKYIEEIEKKKKGLCIIFKKKADVNYIFELR